jgi:uncharacterized protein (TIGR03435 family)
LSIALVAANCVDAQQFEAASVRPAAPLGPRDPEATHGGPGTSDPGRISYRGVTVSELILDAYGIRPLQLSFPASLRLKRYDIVASIPPGTDKEQFNAMVRELLADRFGLRFHRQPTEFNAYKLAVSSRGAKLQETTFKSDDPPKDQRRVYPDGIRMFAGHVTWVPVNGRIVLAAGKTPLRELVNFLESALEGPVTDATGLTGEYDIRMEFSPEGLRGDGLPPRAAPNSNSANSASDPAPNIFQALEQQLGLKLEKSKELLDVLVVDQVNEVPTGN